MAYRPYPNAGRALAQVHRGRPVRKPSEIQRQLAEGARAALTAAGRQMRPLAEALEAVRAAPPRMAGVHISVVRAAEDRARGTEEYPVGEYRLSTRAPVVGGGS